MHNSFPVLHGGSYISLGFSIGKEGEFVYISDVKAIPPETMAYLKSLPKINTLVLDSLKWGTLCGPVAWGCVQWSTTSPTP